VRSTRPARCRGTRLATAAGLAVLSQLDDAAYDRLQAKAGLLADGLRAAFSDAGVPARVPQVGPLVGLFFTSPDDHGPGPVDFDTAAASVALGRYPRSSTGCSSGASPSRPALRGALRLPRPHR